MQRIHTAFRIFYLSCLLLGLALPAVGQVGLAVASGLEQEGESRVHVLTFRGAVTPVLGQYIVDGIEAAQASGASAVILQLDTPGGSVEVTKRIVQDMLASPVPIVVYVAPSAAQAGSAGTFITLAGHVAAMAPGSSIGAASPVGGQGEDVGETMEAKVKNILSADIENLAARRGEKAVEWAVAAVQEAAAATADKALELGVIDFIATDVADLAEQMDGFVVTVQGDAVTLQTAGALVQRLDLSPLQQFLNFITNPSVATILLTLGSVGLIAEIYNPGTFIPGMIGLISLLLGLYALGQLDANFAGLALVGLGILLFLAEAFTPAFGALALGGAVAFIFGSALLFDAPGLAVPWLTILSMTGLMAAFTLFAGGKALSAQRRQPITGREALIGSSATVRSAFDEQGRGTVHTAGELWNAALASGSPTPAIGERVTIEARQGYILLVRKV
ncbi:MAG: nodulation protein NfeD [Caldilineaceae bacterium]|nr:nodulation protein NfeD [Caldilineaceae bacterium]